MSIEFTIEEVNLDTPEGKGRAIEQAEEIIMDNIMVADEVLSGKCFLCKGFDKCIVPKDIKQMQRLKGVSEMAIAAIKEFKKVSTEVSTAIASNLKERGIE